MADRTHVHRVGLPVDVPLGLVSTQSATGARFVETTPTRWGPRTLSIAASTSASPSGKKTRALENGGRVSFDTTENRHASSAAPVDRRRDLAILALDLEARWNRFALYGEWSRAWIDVPGALRAVNAARQEGWYLEGRVKFLEGALPTLPRSSFGAAMRLDAVDFDAGRRGDSRHRTTLRAHFRPTPETVLKLDLQLNEERDRFNLATPSSACLFGLATYF